jgi:transposase
LILDLTEEIGLAYQKLRSVEDNRSIIAWFNTVVKMVALVGRMKVDFAKRFLVGSDLQVVSGQAAALIHYSLLEKGFSGEAYSFRDKRYKSDFNSLALEEALCPSVSRTTFPFLTPRQWAVLEPLLPLAERTGKRGRPPADPRKLLDAIFWKLAHHARWQDLPEFYPPMLTCRRYYRRLLLGGRLDALFSALHQDLLIRGKVSLSTLVEQGSVAVSENKVIMRRELDKSWQMRTALLFLQQGFQALRGERREKTWAYYRRYRSPRLLARDKEIQARSDAEEENFSFTPIDLANLGSDPENVNELAITLGKKRLKVPRRLDTGSYSFIPIDLGNLGSDSNDEDEPPSLESVPPASPLAAPDILSPPGSYSPAVPKTQSHSGELTP